MRVKTSRPVSTDDLTVTPDTSRSGRSHARTRDEARADVFDYIERFDNAVRRHSTIGYVSPIEFERTVGLA